MTGRRGASVDKDVAHRWRAATGKQVPIGLSGKLLAAATEYEEQCRATGGLPLLVKKRLQRLIKIQQRKEGASSGSMHGCGSSKAVSFPVGTQFVREWNGRDHTVIVVKDGFQWNETTYGSLSAAARAITGTRWNGHRFFGVGGKR